MNTRLLMESTLPDNYSKALFEERNYDLAPEHTNKFAYVLFVGAANLLNLAKSKERPTSLEFVNIDDTLAGAAIVQFFPNEDPSKPGNWSLVWTFDFADIPENAKRISIKDPDTHSYFRSIAGDKFGFRFRDTGAIVITLTDLLVHIRKWLDENAKDGDEVVLEDEGVFQARVAVEGGQKVFALEPAGEIKMLIKDDAAIEK